MDYIQNHLEQPSWKKRFLWSKEIIIQALALTVIFCGYYFAGDIFSSILIATYPGHQILYFFVKYIFPVGLIAIIISTNVFLLCYYKQYKCYKQYLKQRLIQQNKKKQEEQKKKQQQQLRKAKLKKSKSKKSKSGKLKKIQSTKLNIDLQDQIHQVGVKDEIRQFNDRPSQMRRQQPQK